MHDHSHQSRTPIHAHLISNRDELAGALHQSLAASAVTLSVSENATAARAELSQEDAQATDVLVTDLDTPGLSDAISDLRASFAPSATLICLASANNLGARLAAIRNGAQACLATNINADLLAERIHALAEPLRASARILVVDDQPVAATFAVRVLERAGYKAEALHVPLEILSALERVQPDLILMDLHMPGANGIELTHIIREREELADVPIVFQSIEPDHELQMSALRSGADDFLAKPIPPKLLIEVVEQCLAKRRRQSLSGRVNAATVEAEMASARAQHLAEADRDSIEAAADVPEYESEQPSTDSAIDALIGDARGSAETAAARSKTRINPKRFKLLYQPILPLKGRQSERYELLPRMRGDDGELLGPDSYLPIARGAGVARKLDRFLMNRALEALTAARGSGRSPMLFVPQSMGTLAIKGWLDRFRDQIAERELIHQPPVVQLDLPEALNNLALLAKRADQFAELHIPLCLANFNENEASAQLLSKLVISYIRITGAGTLPLERLTELVKTAHEYGVQVIVDGISAPASITPLYRASVDLFQGSYVRAPSEGMDFDFSVEVI